MRLPDWIPGVRGHRAHAAAWAPELQRGPDGSTAFAIRSEAAISAKLGELGAEIERRTEHRRKETSDGSDLFVEIQVVRPQLEIWISADQLELHGPSQDLVVERWDADSPVEAREYLLDALEAAVLSAARQCRP